VPHRESRAESQANANIENIYNNLVAQNEAAKAAREASGQGRASATPSKPEKVTGSKLNPVSRNFRNQQLKSHNTPRLPPPSTSSKSKGSVPDRRSKSVDQLYNEYKGRVSGTFEPTQLPLEGLDNDGSIVFAIG